MWSAAVRLKPDTTYEHIAQHVAPLNLDFASHISSKAPVPVARHFYQGLVAQ